ncbi:MAG: hypothetical protein M3R08_07605, partial [Bacteroidota bacterium]|nr:hypothetical protein [Bacteroidota bacterium]
MLRPILFALIISLSACEGCVRDAMEIDVSEVTIDLKIGRLDQHLFHADPDSLREASLRAQADFGEFYRIY